MSEQGHKGATRSDRRPLLWDDPVDEVSVASAMPTPLLPPAGEPTKRVDTVALARAIEAADALATAPYAAPLRMGPSASAVEGADALATVPDAAPLALAAGASGAGPAQPQGPGDPLLGPTGTLRLRANESPQPTRRRGYLALVALLLLGALVTVGAIVLQR